MSIVSILNEKSLMRLNRPVNVIKEEVSNEKHLNTTLLDVEDFIKVNNVQEITDPIFFVRNGVPTPEGLLSNEIFGITKEERSSIFGYIDLYDWFLHPLAYIEWSRMDSRIKDIVFGTKRFIINDKGDFVEDENGECGIKFLKDNFSKIKIKSTESSKRDNKILFLKNNEKEIFIKKYIVIPAYFRDVNSTSDGRVGVGELNKYYSSLIVAVRSLKETQEYGFSMSDATKGRIQETLVHIYNYLCGTGSEKSDGIGLSKKFGIIKRSVMSKTTDEGSRLVISAPNIKAENIESLMVDSEHCALPLASALVNYKPFIIFNVKRFFDNEFANNPTHTLLNEKGETVTVEVRNPEMVFSDTEIEAQMNKFIHGYSKRLTPVRVPLVDGRTAFIQFKGYEPSRDTQEVKDDPRKNTLLSRRLTWCDVFFMAAVEATRDKCVLITRFPMDSYWNEFPAKIRISTMNKTEPIYVGSTFYQWYPLIREKDIDSNTSNMFIDTLQFTNLNLKSIGGDYDGDQTGVKGVWSVESNDECMKIINSKSYYLDLNCMNIKVSTNEAVQSLYSLTKILDVDKSKLEDPVF